MRLYPHKVMFLFRADDTHVFILVCFLGSSEITSKGATLCRYVPSRAEIGRIFERLIIRRDSPTVEELVILFLIDDDLLFEPYFRSFSFFLTFLNPLVLLRLKESLFLEAQIFYELFVLLYKA